VNLLIAIAGVYVFLRSSPFARFQKTLFVFGLLPFYIYPVMNRSYGLGMLLVFLFCAMYPKRFERIVLFSAVLFFLANTHFQSLIFVIAVFISLALEFLTDAQSRAKWRAKPQEVIVGALLILTGIAVSILQIIPDQTSVIYHPHVMPQEIARAWSSAFINPGHAFPDAFGVNSAVATTLMVAMMYLLLIGKQYLLVMAVTSVVGFNLFFYLIYGSFHMRHQGALFLLFISVLWLNEMIKPVALAPRGFLKYLDQLSRQLYVHRNFLLTAVLILYVVPGLSSARRDITSEFSSTRQLSVLLQRDDLKDAVIVGEPAYYLESLVYYLPKPFYFPREGEFGLYGHLNKAEQRNLDLSQLIAIAERLKAQFHKPVVIILGHKIAPQGPYVTEFGYHQTFHYSQDSLREFVAKTRKIASYEGAISDENFGVYLLQ
jgi:hypothetical protein